MTLLHALDALRLLALDYGLPAAVGFCVGAVVARALHRCPAAPATGVRDASGSWYPRED